MKPTISSILRRYFSTGLIVLLPIAATAWVLIWIYGWLELIALQIFPEELTEEVPIWSQILIGLVFIVACITLLGFLARNVAGRWVVRMMDLFMARVPLASTVYNFVKGLTENLGMMQSGYFKRVVLVEYPRPGIWSVGFISRPLEGDIQSAIEGQRTAVFIPTSPNPTSGFIIVVDDQEVISLDITPEQALKFIMSGGVLMPGVNTDDTGLT